MSSGETAIPDDAIEAAAKVYNQIGCPWKSLSEAQRQYYRERGAAILAAALPSLRRHIINEAIREGRVAPIAG